MARITLETTAELQQQIERLVREGWYPDADAVMQEALAQFLESKTFLGDSPRMLHRFAADALNESKPETALKFIGRGRALLATQQQPDLALYQQLMELHVQVLSILGRTSEAVAELEEARALLPNHPAIERWLRKLRPDGSAAAEAR